MVFSFPPFCLRYYGRSAAWWRHYFVSELHVVSILIVNLRHNTFIYQRAVFLHDWGNVALYTFLCSSPFLLSSICHSSTQTQLFGYWVILQTLLSVLIFQRPFPQNLFQKCQVSSFFVCFISIHPLRCSKVSVVMTIRLFSYSRCVS